MIPLLYANNADIKYPLSDFHEESIPNDILLDLSLSVPEGTVPALCALRVGKGFVFLSLEDASTRLPVASVFVSKPRTAKVYPLDMYTDGHGWVVFGPWAAAGKDYYSGDILVDLDPQCVTSLKQSSPLVGISINGFPVEVANVLSLVSKSDILKFEVSGSTIYIDRNDDALSTEEREALGDKVEDISDQILFSLDGVFPDENGNIDVIITGCVQGCDYDKTLPVPRGDTGEGVDGELPLDIFVGKVYTPGDPCAPSDAVFENSSSSEEETDPFAGCRDIVRVTIMDPTESREIGTLYTVGG